MQGQKEEEEKEEEEEEEEEKEEGKEEEEKGQQRMSRENGLYVQSNFQAKCLRGRRNPDLVRMGRGDFVQQPPPVQARRRLPLGWGGRQWK